MRIPFLLIVALAVALACSDSSAPAKPSQLAKVTIISGNSQQGTVGTALALPIVIQAVDSNGHPAVGLFALFNPVTDGSVSAGTVTIDSSGKASTVWTLGATPGRQGLIVTVAQGATNDVIFDTAFATATP